MEIVRDIEASLLVDLHASAGRTTDGRP